MEKESYIVSVNHKTDGRWHQYDIQLAGRYGWDYMLARAQFVSAADLNGAESVTKADHPGGSETELIQAVRNAGNSITTCPDLQYEGSNLGVAGNSRNLKCPVKVVWFNQTNLLRIFTFDKEIKNIEAYASCIVNRFFPDDFNKKAKAKPRITARDKRKAGLVLLILGVIWLLGAVIITLTVDGFLPIGSLWYIMALSFIGFGLYQRKKPENETPQPVKAVKAEAPQPKAKQKPAPQPEKPMLWLILNKANSIYPYMENDRSARVYRYEGDARAYIINNFTLDITTMPIDEDLLPKRENMWLRYGVKTVKVYSDKENFTEHKCAGNDTEYTGSMMASLMLRMIQNKKADATAQQKADWSTWQSALAHQLNRVPLLVPFRYGDSADQSSAADTRLHISAGAAPLLSALLKDKDGNPIDPMPGWLGMGLLTKNTTGVMWKDGQVVYIGSADVINSSLAENSTDFLYRNRNKMMHPLFADNTKTQLHAIAAFTNLQDLRALYPNERVAVFSFQELLPLAKEGHGLIIDPGAKGICYLMNHNFLAEISEKAKQPMQFYSLPREYAGKRKVILQQIGESKTDAISVIRRISPMSLMEAKELVDNLPAEIKTDISHREAELIVKLFADKGATATIENI
ncbi:MAG: ribosomal protein L7/L12 [Oscillospiraceae bacterium]|nr:ribosomal protein L7/L12 [Oscillospiraceae bacterium]